MRLSKTASKAKSDTPLGGRPTCSGVRAWQLLERDRGSAGRVLKGPAEAIENLAGTEVDAAARVRFASPCGQCSSIGFIHGRACNECRFA
jgi:hypothetical protein